MSDSLNDLFRERFQGHEMPVDASVWQGVQGHLEAASGPDEVSDLFRDRFQGHEMAVDPAVWTSISTQLGHTVATGTVASGAFGWIAAGIAAVVFSAGALVLTQEEGSSPVAEVIEVVEPAASTPIPTEPAPVETNTAATSIGAAPSPSTPVNRNSPRSTPQVQAPAATPVLVADAQEENAPVSVPPGAEPTTPKEPVAGEDVVEQIVSRMTADAVAAARAEEEARKERERATRSPQGGTPETEQDVAQEDGSPAAPLPKLYLQNIFTPNGDGHNDVYQIVGAEAFDRILFRVFSVSDNRLVFSSNNKEWWTGANCPDGYYLVAVEAVTPDGRMVTEGKVVWLNRSPMN